MRSPKGRDAPAYNVKFQHS